MAIIGASAAAFVMTIVMLFQGLRGGYLPGCGEGSGCDAISRSRWARLWRIPVAAPGSIVYLAVLAAAAILRLPDVVEHQKMLWFVLATSALMAAGAALWFIALQLLVIRRTCLYCMVTHGAGLAAGALVVFSSPWAILPLIPIVMSAVLALAVLVAGQILIEPPTFAVSVPMQLASPMPAIALPPAPLPTPDPAPATDRLVERRKITLAKNTAELWTGDWPILGSPDADHILASLFDYTCPDCRHVHQLLHDAVQHFGQQLAILLIPAPLNTECNQWVQENAPHHANACGYAQLALAVWLANPKKFMELDQWLWTPPTPPPLADARKYADSLVGSDCLAATLANPVIAQRIAVGVSVYRFAGMPTIPKLLLPDAVVWGRVPTAKDMVGVLEKQLKLNSPD